MNIETTVLTHFTLIKHFFLDLGGRCLYSGIRSSFYYKKRRILNLEILSFLYHATNS